MKNREEMIRDVHRRIDAYASERKMKRAGMSKAVVSVTSVCAAVIVSIGLWMGGVFTPADNQVIGNNTEAASSGPEHIIRTESNSVDNRIVDAPDTQPVPQNTEETDSRPQTAFPIRQTATTEPSGDSSFTNNRNDDTPDTQPVPQKAPEETDCEPQNAFPLQPVTAAEPDGDITRNNVTGYDGDALGSVIIDGITYRQTFSDTNEYTPEEYLGNGGDFTGSYQGDTSVSFFTAKENPDIVIAVFYDGSQLNLTKT